MTRLHHAIALQEAARQAPGLGLLLERMQRAQQCLRTVTDLIPAPLRAHVQAGPIDDDQWCILTPNTAACAKLRQLLPAMQERLAPLQIKTIRLKVLTSGR